MKKGAENFENEFPCHLTRAAMDTLDPNNRTRLLEIWRQLQTEKKNGGGDKNNQQILGPIFKEYCDLVEQARKNYRQILAEQK